MADATATVPGVAGSSLSYLTPLSGRNWTHRVEVTGGPTLARPEQTAWVNAVAPGWFETYRMRLIAGRDFLTADVAQGEPIAVVNEAFVKRFAGSRNPLGLRIRGVGLARLNATIVGVVNDAVYRTVRIGVVPTIYLPMAQANRFGTAFSITARLAGNRAAVEEQIAEVLSASAPGFSFSFRHYEDQVRATLIQERLVAMLSGFFGLLALLLFVDRPVPGHLVRREPKPARAGDPYRARRNRLRGRPARPAARGAAHGGRRRARSRPQPLGSPIRGAAAVPCRPARSGHARNGCGRPGGRGIDRRLAAGPNGFKNGPERDVARVT